MKPEDKVCTLEQAKELHKLGLTVPADSCWVLFESSVTHGELPEQEDYDLLSACKYEESDAYVVFDYYAYDVAELGGLLPVTVEVNGRLYWIACTKADDGWSGCAEWFEDRLIEDYLFYTDTYKTEAEARTATLLKLLSCNYLNTKELNEECKTVC